jgi:hypothetical protein
MGTWTVSVTQVPEPGHHLLMLAALTLIGMRIHRQRHPRA